MKQRNTNSLLYNKDKCASFGVTKIPQKKKKKELHFLISVPTAASEMLQEVDYLVLGPLGAPEGIC